MTALHALRDRSRPRQNYGEGAVVRLRLPLLVALLATLALLTMHGVTAHGLALGHDDDHAGAAAGPSGELAADHDSDHDHGTQHHDDDDGAPCSGCAHGAGALCALIVLGVVVSTRRMRAALVLPTLVVPRPPRRTWRPDPPVPKFALVPALL